MAKLDAQSKWRGAARSVPNPPDEPSASGADLRATVTLSAEALSALLDQVKKSQGEEQPAAADDPAQPAEAADRRPPQRARRADR
jgi:hypothetical protein